MAFIDWFRDTKKYLDKNGLRLIAKLTEKRFRYKTMPVASEEYEGAIVEYIGTVTPDYTPGYFYRCRNTGTVVAPVWAWVQHDVQPNDDVPHWTGTHAEYEAQKDTIPDYAILHFTDDYEEANSIYKKSFTMYQEDGVTPGGTCHALKYGPLVVLRIQGFNSTHHDNGVGYTVMPAGTLPRPVAGTDNCHSTMHASLTNGVVCTAFVRNDGALVCESAEVADKAMYGGIVYYTVDESYDYSSWTRVVN